MSFIHFSKDRVPWNTLNLQISEGKFFFSKKRLFCKSVSPLITTFILCNEQIMICKCMKWCFFPKMNFLFVVLDGAGPLLRIPTVMRNQSLRSSRYLILKMKLMMLLYMHAKSKVKMIFFGNLLYMMQWCSDADDARFFRFSHKEDIYRWNYSFWKLSRYMPPHIGVYWKRKACLFWFSKIFGGKNLLV